MVTRRLMSGELGFKFLNSYFLSLFYRYFTTISGLCWLFLVALRKSINTSKILLLLIDFVSLFGLTDCSIGHPAFGPIYTVHRQSTVEYICLFLRLLPASTCPLVHALIHRNARRGWSKLQVSTRRGEEGWGRTTNEIWEHSAPSLSN